MMKRDQNSPLGSSNLYLLSTPLCYFTVFLLPELSLPIHIFLLLWSYRLIFFMGSFTPVIVLIIYSRAFVGFSASSNLIGYNEINILTNYLPMLIYLFNYKEKTVQFEQIIKYPWPFAYGLVLIIYSLTPNASPLEVLGDRLIPFLFILIVLFTKISGPHLRYDFLRIMRYLVVSSVVVSFLPDYLEKTVQYLQNGTVFGRASESSVLLGDLSRLMGPLWDPRIFGTLCALYLAVFLFNQKTFKLTIDPLLAILGVSLSLSRGAMVLALIVILFYFLRSDSSFKQTARVVTICAVTLTITAGIYFSLDTLFVVNNVNPIQQRADFSLFAISSFAENPWGSGIGSMRSISQGVVVLNSQYFAVTDAYLAIILAETGFLGFIIFVLSFHNLIWGSHVISRGLFFGILVQMIGTDVGDFGMYFFVIVIMCMTLRLDTIFRSKRASPHIIKNAGTQTG